MPYRSAAGLFITLGGLVAVAGLVLIGVDVYAASRRGPRWKRRLLGAGLAVLGMLGVGAGYVRATTPSCYMPGNVIGPDPSRSLQRLNRQFELLCQLANEDKLTPDTVRKALAAAEAALAEASDPEVLKSLSPEEQASALALIKNTRAQIERLKARLGSEAETVDSLENAPDWKVLSDAWDYAKPLAIGGSTTKQRSESDSRFKAAREASERLVAAGLLASAEASLLAAEAEKVASDIRREPPTDAEVTCYSMAPLVWPDYRGLDRLKHRLPLLQELAAGGKVHRAVIEKVLGTIEVDLASLNGLLADAKGVTGGKREEVQTTRDAVNAELEKLRKLLDAGGQPRINAGEGK